MKQQKIPRHQLRSWLIAQAALIVVGSTLTFAFLDFLRNQVFSENPNYNPIFAVGMIGPMAALTGVLFGGFAIRLSRHINGLTEALRRMAGGDLTVRLAPEAGGPLAAAYEDFNTMAGELQSVQTLRSDFIQNYSHEFRTPISAIVGFTELLQEPGCAPEDRAQYLDVIAQESRRLADLAESTLLLSRLDTQTMPLRRVPYALDEQIKKCSILFSDAWTKKQITFSVELEEVTYPGDPEMMRHVWINLLSNAVKYTPEGGEIEVRMARREGEIAVSVSDTGIGMTPEVQAHIFDKYYQGDLSRQTKGLGLGLSIVRRILTLCGGRISVQSTPGEGSVFQVLLPDAPG